MKAKRLTDTPEKKSFWDMVDRVAREVDSWPAWKKGELMTDDPRIKHQTSESLIGRQSPPKREPDDDTIELADDAQYWKDEYMKLYREIIQMTERLKRNERSRR